MDLDSFGVPMNLGPNIRLNFVFVDSNVFLLYSLRYSSTISRPNNKVYDLFSSPGSFKLSQQKIAPFSIFQEKEASKPMLRKQG